jgi:hypothetical protein
MRRLGVLLAGLAVLAAPSPAPANIHKKPICRPGHAHLVEADKQAQVYEAGSREGVSRIMGCVYNSRHQFLVATSAGGSGGGSGAHVVQLLGTLVALEGETNIPEYLDELDYVYVIDLRIGRTIRESGTGPPDYSREHPRYGQFDAGPAASLVLRPNGDLAWITDTPKFRVTSAGAHQVYTLEGSERHMIASGDNIEERSLALAGETIYWTQGGKPFSAPLK